MKQNKILSLVGPPRRRAKQPAESFPRRNPSKEGKACLVIVSVESSGQHEEKIYKYVYFYKVPMYLYRNKDELGAAMGKKKNSELPWL